MVHTNDDGPTLLLLLKEFVHFVKDYLLRREVEPLVAECVIQPHFIDVNAASIEVGVDSQGWIEFVHVLED